MRSPIVPETVVRLKVVPAPSVGAVVSAPPTLIASTNTIDYCCGHCEVVLMHAEDGQVHNLVIYREGCGSYNTADS